MVGMTGFEPATLRSQSECATKLRHIPVLTRPDTRPEGVCLDSLALTLSWARRRVDRGVAGVAQW